MIIGIDLDSTTNDLLDTWLAVYNQIYNDNLSVNDIVTWDTHLYVKPACGKHIYDLLTPELFMKCTPMFDSQLVTRQLAKEHTLVVISDVWNGTYDAKRIWLKHYFPWIEHFIATSSKRFVDCDIFLDDSPHQLESIGPGRAVAYAYPYNAHWEGRRVFTWNEFHQLIRNL